jgi:hypothetical protein
MRKSLLPIADADTIAIRRFWSVDNGFHPAPTLRLKDPT